jgi:hypothetical protein
MALAFQDMLERFDLTEKILTFNADNATANDKQTTKLAALDNSFDEANRVRCFNHTLQLSAKSLLVPFNTAISGKAAQDDEALEEDDNDILQFSQEEDEDDGEDGEEDDVNEEDVEDKDDEDDGIDELEELSESERTLMLESTADVRETVTKV